MKNLAVLALALLLAGCYRTNEPERWQKTHYSQMPAEMRGLLEPLRGDPRIIRGGDPEERAKELIENGYVCVGISSFTWSQFPTDEEILVACKRARAEIAAYTSKYSHTQSGTRGVPTYQMGQTYTANTQGTVGYRSVPYSQTTTVSSPGTWGVAYVPYESRVYEHFIGYWRRAKPRAFGAFFADSDETFRKKIGRNVGVTIKAVMKDAPAYKADLFSGDVIMSVNEKVVTNVASIQAELISLAGQTVKMVIMRDDKELTKEVQLNPQPVLDQVDEKGDHVIPKDQAK